MHLIQGGIALGLGLAALSWPEPTILVLVIMFSVYVFSEGTFEIVSGFLGKKRTSDLFSSLLTGLIYIVSGMGALFRTGVNRMEMGILIGVWAILLGSVFLFTAIESPPGERGRLFNFVLGSITVVLGMLILLFPDLSSHLLLMIVGLDAAAWGMILLSSTILDRISRSHKAKAAA